MSEPLDRLLAIAEIASVFVGFAVFVSIIASRPAMEKHDYSFKLFHIVNLGLLVIAASFVPVVLSGYEMQESTVWRLSSSLFFVLNWVFIIFANRVAQGGYRTAHARMRIMSTAAWVLEPLCQIPLLLCIVGVWQDLAAAFYLTAIVAVFFQILVIFVDLATSLIANEAS